MDAQQTTEQIIRKAGTNAVWHSPAQTSTTQYDTKRVLIGFHRKAESWLHLLDLNPQESANDILGKVLRGSDLRADYAVFIVKEDFSVFKVVPYSNLSLYLEYPNGH